MGDQLTRFSDDAFSPPRGIPDEVGCYFGCSMLGGSRHLTNRERRFTNKSNREQTICITITKIRILERPTRISLANKQPRQVHVGPMFLSPPR